MWTGWPPFDVGFCKFELDQWFVAFDVLLNGALEGNERWKAGIHVRNVEDLIEAVLTGENAEVEASTYDVED